MMNSILTLNAGSSSIKFALFDAASLTLRATGQADRLGAEGAFCARLADASFTERSDWSAGLACDHAGALSMIFDWLQHHDLADDVVAAGHRVVHGGQHFTGPVRIDAVTLDQIAALCPIAPLHQPHNVAGIVAARSQLGHVAQVATFDTAFHRTQPRINRMYGLPRAYFEDGIQRYGMHGLSFEHIAEVMKQSFPRALEGRVVVAHLGNGASLCAMRNGRSVASTMGFTVLDGLAMGTRCGQLDPGVLLYLMQHKGMSAEQIAELLYRRSGLLGLSGLSNDLRTIEHACTGDASEAQAYFAERVRREIGAMAAALGGLDALVFTGGIGENSPAMRSRITAELGWLGVEIDPALNRPRPPAQISSNNSGVLTLCIPANEERTIAKHTLSLLPKHASLPRPSKSAMNAPQAVPV